MSSYLGMWNGLLRPTESAVLSVTSEAVLYGVGAFTTVCVRSGELVDFGRHAARLQRDAAVLGLEVRGLPHLEARCREVIAANGLSWSALRISLFADHGQVQEWIQVRDNVYPKDGYVEGRRLRPVECAPRRDRFLCRIKSLNYAEHWLALREAREAGFDDALWIDTDGSVLETAVANVFVVYQGVCYTPPASEGILPGILRERLLEALPEIRECPIAYAWLRGATEVFATNSLGGIMSVTAVGAFSYTAGPWTAKARAAVTNQ